MRNQMTVTPISFSSLEPRNIQSSLAVMPGQDTNH